MNLLAVSPDDRYLFVASTSKIEVYTLGDHNPKWFKPDRILSNGADVVCHFHSTFLVFALTVFSSVQTDINQIKCGYLQEQPVLIMVQSSGAVTIFNIQPELDRFSQYSYLFV